jgi:hypothetical protein
MSTDTPLSTEDVPDEFDDSYDDECELDAFEEAMYDCHGHFDEQGPGGIFICGAVGSEDCDECPCHAWLGLTNRQIDALEEKCDEGEGDIW